MERHLIHRAKVHDKLGNITFNIAGDPSAILSTNCVACQWTMAGQVSLCRCQEMERDLCCFHLVRFRIWNSSAEEMIESILWMITLTMRATEVRLLVMSSRDQGAIDQINRHEQQGYTCPQRYTEAGCRWALRYRPLWENTDYWLDIGIQGWFRSRLRDILAVILREELHQFLDYGGHHYFMCTVHSASMRSNGCTQWATCAYFYSLWLFTETTQKIKYWYNTTLCGFWL